MKKKIIKKIKDTYLGLYTFGLIIAFFYSAYSIIDVANNSWKNTLIYIIAALLSGTGLYFVIKSIPKVEDKEDPIESMKKML